MAAAPRPHFGFTRHGHEVHFRTLDHLRAPHGAPWYDRVNSWLAIRITRSVGTMWCAYIFAAFDLLALPTAIKGGLYGIVQWVASFFLQLVLLSIIMVGQAGQARASDARSAKQFEDTEVVVDRLDTSTEGGITEILAAIREITRRLDSERQEPGADL